MPYIGKIEAYVTDNDWTDDSNGCPYKGCVKVIAPDYFGCKAGSSGESYEDWVELPAWIEPCFEHPMDFYVPAIGEPIYIECLSTSLEDFSEMVWHRSFGPGSENFSNFVSGEEAEAINTNVDELTDRIIGTRNGSIIKIEDKASGKLIIEAEGKNLANSSRKGHKITLDPAVGIEILEKGQKNKITITAQDIVVDDLENGNKVTLNSSGLLVTDKNGNKITLASSGIELEDKTGNKVTMASGGIKIDATAGSKAEVKGTTIDMLAATEAFLKGTTFDVWLQLFITWATTHTHTCTAPGSPSSQPIVPPAPCTGHLSTTIKGA